MIRWRIQTCPDCGRTEACGTYCTGCLRPMSEADWYANPRTLAMVADRVARQNAPQADLGGAGATETPAVDVGATLTKPRRRGPKIEGDEKPPKRRV